MIDAHVHFWNFDPARDKWINNDMEILQRNFLPQDLLHVASRHGVKGVLAVQADQSENETRFLCDLASENDLIKGVIGWVNLKSDTLDEQLQRYSEMKIIKGFRHILQAEAPGFMLQPSFIRGVQSLKQWGFTYDILVYHDQLRETLLFLDKLPDQKFILDHCAKPPIAVGGIKDWKKNLSLVAEHKNVFCKLSGLVTEAKWHHWKKKEIIPYLDVVIECFGTERVLFGSDWPVLYTSASYYIWMELLKEYLQQWDSTQQENIFSENAKRIYSL